MFWSQVNASVIGNIKVVIDMLQLPRGTIHGVSCGVETPPWYSTATARDVRYRVART